MGEASLTGSAVGHPPAITLIYKLQKQLFGMLISTERLSLYAKQINSIICIYQHREHVTDYVDASAHNEHGSSHVQDSPTSGTVPGQLIDALQAERAMCTLQ